jgi:hypothetical protein
MIASAGALCQIVEFRIFAFEGLAIPIGSWLKITIALG